MFLSRNNGAICEQPKPQNTDTLGFHLNSRFVRDGRYTFNICGQRYEVLYTTIQRYPNTLLADEKSMDQFWDGKRQEYFLDRNRTCFEAVLSYYQSKGILSRPSGIPVSLFLKEIEFYDLDEDILKTLRDKDMQERNLKPESRPMPTSHVQQVVWNLFEYPDTSNAARCIALLSCTVVLLSIVLFCVETLPQFQKQDDKDHDVFFTLEAACISWFTFEYLTRLLSSPNKLKFVREALNVIDLTVILAFFIAFAFNTNVSNISSIVILRTVRICRIFKLSRHFTGLQVLGMTFRASLKELGLLVFFLSVGVVLFASAIYSVERSEKDTEFKSIPHSFWWAIITMTTVGYGDLYPTTLWGKLIGSLCACTGILAIALPVPVIVANFERFYKKAQKQGKQNSKNVQEAEEKYNALKGFFDRIKRRSTRSSDNSFRDNIHREYSTERKHLDRNPETVKVISNETSEDTLVKKDNNAFTSKV